MQKSEVKELLTEESSKLKLEIAKAVTEAKLEVAEKRLHHALWFGGVFFAILGVFVPVLMAIMATNKVDNTLDKFRQEISQTNKSLSENTHASEEKLDRSLLTFREDVRAQGESQERQLGGTISRVDNASKDMRQQFKELAGTQLRKPLLECLLKGSSLEGEILNFTPEHRQKTIQIKNVGDAPARNIRIRLYTNMPEDCLSRGEETQWELLSLSDEPRYKYAFQTYGALPIDPKDSRTIDLFILNETAKAGNYQSLLKVFYEQPEPRKYSFTIDIRVNK